MMSHHNDIYVISTLEKQAGGLKICGYSQMEYSSSLMKSLWG